MINEPGKRSRGRWEILDSVSLYRERAELMSTLDGEQLSRSVLA